MLMKTTVAPTPSLAGTSGITLDALRVSYHGNVVLKPLTLTIEPGEVLALIGPSGSGKTTVLRAIAGFVQPAGGRILLGDTDITHLPPYQRGLGMVVQNYALFPHMKVEDNVAFGLRAQKQPKAAIRTSFPAASSSESRLPAPSPCVRGYCCLMSRSRRWMRKSVTTWWRKLPVCTANCRS